jgi:hypothetical protein
LCFARSANPKNAAAQQSEFEVVGQVCVYAMGGVRATGDRSVDGGKDAADHL